MARTHWPIVALSFFCVVLSCAPWSARALDANAVRALASEDGDTKLAAINKMVNEGDVAAIALFKAMQDDALHVFNCRVVFVTDGKVKDALSGEMLDVPSDKLEAVIVNNRIRGALDGAIAALRLVAPDRQERLAAALAVTKDANEELLPLIRRAWEKETDPAIKAQLAQARASIELKSPDANVRREAIAVLTESKSSQAKQFLAALLEKGADGNFTEPDASVREAAKQAIQEIDSHFVLPQIAGTLFYGLSLGSVLLLAALGLAITFGLMGIINMAHGEMLMIGAYTTYVVQTVFRQYFPGAFEAYLLAAVPAAFAISALVGIVLERTVIRHLYGRPLETLLTTWGISLILIQLVRTIFGAQNVEVENPSWMSGGFALGGDVVLPYNRLVIVLFAAFVVFLVWLFLSRTRLGLYVRAVTQNRRMADCVGIATPRVDWMTFGLGSGIAGLGGVALSQIGNVGPDLGQSYIVDSFMVVVLGGVGQLAGTVIAAIGLGEINKLLEPFTGAVLGKIFVLIFIILFIQKRPQGLFAMKGRAAEH
jgi:urea transport system permease protein